MEAEEEQKYLDRAERVWRYLEKEERIINELACEYSLVNQEPDKDSALTNLADLKIANIIDEETAKKLCAIITDANLPESVEDPKVEKFPDFPENTSEAVAEMIESEFLAKVGRLNLQSVALSLLKGTGVDEGNLTPEQAQVYRENLEEGFKRIEEMILSRQGELELLLHKHKDDKNDIDIESV